MNENHYILIMAGGVGSRFWPASRESLPKQFLDILGIGKSLIRITYERSAQVVPHENILIATNARYKNLVMEHLPELNENQILLEPSRNNTAPCIAYAALKIKSLNADASFAVLPSDHVIKKEKVFIQKIHSAFQFADNNDALITLGITPSRPDTGYGYIEIGSQVSGVGFQESIYKVERFTEKPNLENAKAFIKSGNYVWNAGIFIWSVSSAIKAFKNNAPQILEVLSEDLSCFNTEKEQSYIDEHYPKTESISVDYALMERSSNVFTIPADIGWSDLGTWNSLHDFLEKDDHGNVIQAGEAVNIESKNNFIRTSDDKLVVIKGLENFIVIEDGDVLLIYPKDQEQEIKEIRNNLNVKYQ